MINRKRVKYLYHYGSLRSCISWRNLRRLTIYNRLVLQSPTRFNDPFDCRALFSVKQSDEAFLRKFFAKQHLLTHPNTKVEEAESVADLIIQNEWRIKPALM